MSNTTIYQPYSQTWKPTTIIPIHKPGKPTSSPSSFRPISLTSCISKLFLSARFFLAKIFTSNRIISPLARPAFVLVGRLSTKFLLCLNQSGTASKRKSLQAEPFWHLLTSTRLLTRSGTLLCFTNSSCSNSPLISFFGYALSFLIVELKSRLVVLAVVPSASDEGSLRARYLVQSYSSCLLMTSPRIYLGGPMPPSMLMIWPSGPPLQTRSKHLLLSNLPSLS